MTTIQTLAASMFAALIEKPRDNGESFYSFKDGSPEWFTDISSTAHGDMMPDDWRYSIMRDCLSSIADADADESPDDLRDCISEWADSDTDVYNGQLANWLSSNLARGNFVDEAIDEYGWPKDRGIYGALALGQLLEREEVYSLLISALAEHADTISDFAEVE